MLPLVVMEKIDLKCILTSPLVLGFATQWFIRGYLLKKFKEHLNSRVGVFDIKLR